MVKNTKVRNATPTEYDGIKFKSKLEAYCYKQLKENSIIILKINNTFYKPILEIIYLLNSLFEKTLIVKPNTSDISSFDKYEIF